MDQYDQFFPSDDEQYGVRGGNQSSSSSYAIKQYARPTTTSDLEQMRTEIARLETIVQNELASRSNRENNPKNLQLDRIHHSTTVTTVEKYMEAMELIKCLRRQKEYLVSENRKRQRFAEKIQAAMPPSTDSIQFMKNVKFPGDEELIKFADAAYHEMKNYQVNGTPVTYLGWSTKREAKSMYSHAYSEKTFTGIDMIQVLNETWNLQYDEVRQASLYRRRTRFCILKKIHDDLYLTRNIHQFVGESFPRHAMTLVSRLSVDQDTFVIISKSVVPPISDAQHLVWTDECFMWKFSRRADGGFDVSLRGQYGSTSAIASNRLPMLESYFLLIDWESLVVRPMFNFA